MQFSFGKQYLRAREVFVIVQLEANSVLPRRLTNENSVTSHFQLSPKHCVEWHLLDCFSFYRIKRQEKERKNERKKERERTYWIPFEHFHREICRAFFFFVFCFLFSTSWIMFLLILFNISSANKISFSFISCLENPRIFYFHIMSHLKFSRFFSLSLSRLLVWNSFGWFKD